MGLVSQARPNQSQCGSLSVSVHGTESNPRWGWLGVACETGHGAYSVNGLEICVEKTEIQFKVSGRGGGTDGPYN